jgi:hypothetical protein
MCKGEDCAVGRVVCVGIPAMLQVQRSVSSINRVPSKHIILGIATTNWKRAKGRARRGALRRGLAWAMTMSLGVGLMRLASFLRVNTLASFSFLRWKYPGFVCDGSGSAMEARTGTLAPRRALAARARGGTPTITFCPTRAAEEEHAMPTRGGTAEGCVRASLCRAGRRRMSGLELTQASNETSDGHSRKLGWAPGWALGTCGHPRHGGGLGF